jgi:light-regulated signal transduction histidine kinase (bacteriophytochrome)
MYDMIEGVLHYSKLGSESNPLEIVDLNEIIIQIRTDLEVLIEMKNAEIVLDTLPNIKADRPLMYQLFYNLILNSLKFSKSDVPANITILSSEVLREGKEYVQITLTDNGIGFESRYSENIFHTFTRLNSADLYEGSGLGLALCKKIVERYHGTISANSQPGNGATFIILFPTNK